MTSNLKDDANSRHIKNTIAIAAIGVLLIGATAALSVGSLALTKAQQFAAAQQTEEQQNQTQTSNATTVANTTMTDTFAANGVITGTIQSQSGGGSQGASSSPFLVGGEWTLEVESGNVTNFAANFTMVRTDGSEHHSHDITNFKLGNNTQYQLDPTSKSTINGTADYAVNGTSKWPGSDTNITIEGARILSIQPEEQEVKDHFQGQPIYGIVSQATGENGTVIAESAPAGGNQTQEQGGSPLENLTKPFEDLFG
jgi:hypothetical protein